MAGLLIFAQLFYVSYSAASEAKLIPNEAEYSAFLLNGWRAERPNVLVFKDPFCPYCIKAIPKLKQLTGYNVYVFWAPILANRSQNRVDEIFNCERFASQIVLSAVQQRQSPECIKPQPALKQFQRQLNDKIVSNYKINAVPGFYIQGKNVSLNTLLSMQNKRPMINGVNIRWEKFKLMKQANFYDAKNLVMFIPSAKAQAISQLINQYQPEYLFLDNQLIEQNEDLLPCSAEDEDCLTVKKAEYKNKSAEFKLLMGHSILSDQAAIFNMSGKQIQ